MNITRIHTIILTTFVLVFVLIAPHQKIHAQNEMTLTVTPPFFQLTMNPDEVWNSTLKIANVNDFDITLYASPVNFESVGDTGQGKFLPLLSQEPEYLEQSLAGWINVTREPIFIRAGDTIELPFSIGAPKNASPGGHYASILVGTQPAQEEGGGPQISVSTLISSLIFVRLSGDIDEKGGIREISTGNMFFQEPDVPITLRFENKGNVHLLPQGDITIYNMWGKERGIIPINQKTDFGNVLPQSVRKFSYKWMGEPSPYEVGWYRAVATLSFGKDARQNVTQATTFWVIPIVPVLSILGVLTLLFYGTTWFIKGYIRRAFLIESGNVHNKKFPKLQSIKAKTLTQPLVDGVMDLRQINLQEENKKTKETLTTMSFIAKYKIFFIFVVFIIIVVFAVRIYFGQVLVNDRAFEVQEILPQTEL